MRSQVFKVVFVTPIIWAASAVDRYCEFFTSARKQEFQNIFDKSCFNYIIHQILPSQGKVFAKWVSKWQSGAICQAKNGAPRGQVSRRRLFSQATGRAETPSQIGQRSCFRFSPAFVRNGSAVDEINRRGLASKSGAANGRVSEPACRFFGGSEAEGTETRSARPCRAPWEPLSQY